MKIAVIGACGKTGSLVCQEAYSRGYDVIGFTRAECGIPGIKYVIGDGLILSDLEKAIIGADIVISTVGHVKLKEPYIQTKITKNIIKICQENNINKIISMTGTGVRVPKDKISLIEKVLNGVLLIIDKNRVEDGILHAKELNNSNLSFVILRVLKLSNSKYLQKYMLSEHGPAKNFINRVTAAKILVDLIELDVWDKKSPIVS
jgi:nucleoside-diphosphate-sugar epimerase